MQPGSPAQGYGCDGFPGRRAPHTDEGSLRDEARRLSSIDVGGPITVDTTWAADTVRVHSEVTILDGMTLTVAAGTFVEFHVTEPSSQTMATSLV